MNRLPTSAPAPAPHAFRSARARRLCAAACLGLALAALPFTASAQSTRQRIDQLAQRWVDQVVADDPIRASTLGITAADGLLEVPSEARRAAGIVKLQNWKRELDGIAMSAGDDIGLVEKNDIALLRADFDSRLNELVLRESDRRNHAEASLSLMQVVFSQFLHLPIVGRDGATAADLDRGWDDLTSRLEKGTAYIDGGEQLATKPGKLFGTVALEQLDGAPDFFAGALGDAAKVQMAARPAQLARFVAARDAVLARIARTRAFIAANVASWPDNHAIGKAGYDRMLREEQLLPFDSTDIERMARDELAHGWAEEAWLQSLSKLKKIPFGPESGGGLAPGGPPLVGYYRDRIADLTSFVKKNDVVTVPAWLGEMQIVETPSFIQPVSPGASMYSPRLFSKSSTGYYFITPPKSLAAAAARLDMYQDFDRDRILSTGAHEAMPGHFLQLSIARRHPSLVRRLQHDAAFAEGWAFYGEEMFVRLGLYGEGPADGLDARLFTARWERLRGARAIVDPKLASGEWTVAQAVDFFEQQSGSTHEASQAAVNGIALYPGYVISYTVGRLQLQTLLGEYLRRMGDRASLRDFHDRLLSYGSTPLAVVGPELLADLDKPGSAVRAAANY